MNYLTCCLLLSMSITSFSQPADYFPAVDETDLPDARFKTPETYTGTSLFGLIDGGAELYLEYGFSGAWINEIHLMGGKYKTEIYRMNGTEEAFGIFSVSRYRCNSTPSLSPFTCQTPYQLQICSGPFYISIINSTGNIADSAASMRIAEAIVKKIREKPADLTCFFPGVPLQSVYHEAILVKGKLGIMNGAPDLADYFGEMTGYSAVILQHEKMTLVSVRFKTKDDMDAFMSLHDWDPATIPADSCVMPAGETVKRVSDNHLLISIRQ